MLGRHGERISRYPSINRVHRSIPCHVHAGCLGKRSQGSVEVSEAGPQEFPVSAF